MECLLPQLLAGDTNGEVHVYRVKNCKPRPDEWMHFEHTLQELQS